MANIKLSTIEERLETMRRADNNWADAYVRDVSHLLKLVKATAVPGDEVAQRARAAAEAIIAEWKVDMGKAITYERMITDIESGIVKHFTATDVEQGTCTWTLIGTRQWRSQCGDISHHRDGDFCCFCGKRLAEKATEGREEGEGR